MTFRSFILEALSGFLANVLAATFIALVAFVVWRLTKYPGFRVGASWHYNGWNLQLMGRFPNASDSGVMEFCPKVAVNSYDPDAKKIIHSVWVRERANPYNTGNIFGHLDLTREGVPLQARTTGGDPLHLTGPIITAPASKFHEIINCPVFVQTSDGLFFRAESIGNSATGIARFRYRWRNVRYKIKQQIFSIGKYLQTRLAKWIR